jgi:hypothetical protein
MARERRTEIHIKDSTFGDQTVVNATGPVTQMSGGPVHPALEAANALVRLVAEHRSELPAAMRDKIRRDALDVRAELCEPEPDEGRIRAALERIGQRAVVVLPVAGAAAEILGLFHP